MSSADDRRVRRDRARRRTRVRRARCRRCAVRSRPDGARPRSTSWRGSSSRRRPRRRRRRRIATSRAAFAGARVVVNCAGPLREIGEPVLVAALAPARTTSTSAAIRRSCTRSTSVTNRRRGAPGWSRCRAAALDCALGDLAAARGPRARVRHRRRRRRRGAHRAGAAHRARIARSTRSPSATSSTTSCCRPAASARCSARSHTRRLVWRRDRWEHGARRRAEAPRQRRARDRRRARCRVVSRRRRDHGAAPRRGAHASQTFVSTTRSAARERPRCACSRARCRSCRSARPSCSRRTRRPDADYARTQLRGRRAGRGADSRRRRSSCAARDLYRTTRGDRRVGRAPARARTAGPIGMRAPARAVSRRAAALRELARPRPSLDRSSRSFG